VLINGGIEEYSYSCEFNYLLIRGDTFSIITILKELEHEGNMAFKNIELLYIIRIKRLEK
jgi:hypothetical protein